MKQLLLTTCAVAALCGTAFAQAPAEKNTAAPAAKSGMSAQPSGSPATKPSAQAPADKSAAPADKAAGSMGAKPSGAAATQSPNDKMKGPSSATAAAPKGSMEVSFYTVTSSDVQASNLIGATVYNLNNESIGDIEDIIIDDQKALRAVVIGVGGFLGMGEHDVAVEPTALEIMRNNDNDDVKIVLNTTKEALKDAPAVKFDKKSRQQAASDGSSTAGGSSMPKAGSTTGAGNMAKDKDLSKDKPMGKADDASKAGGMEKSDTMSKSKSGMKKAN